MQQKDQVCTFEQAKKLRDLGVNQDSYSYWHGNDEEHDIDNPSAPPVASAFSVAELGELLPRNIATFQIGYETWRIANTFDYASGHGEEKIGKYYTGTSRTYIDFTAHTEAELRAKFLIHLIESGELQSPKINPND